MSDLKCGHPPELRKPGPRIPRAYGSGPSEVCACGAWRPVWYSGATWRSSETLAEAIQEDENR